MKCAHSIPVRHLRETRGAVGVGVGVWVWRLVLWWMSADVSE